MRKSMLFVLFFVSSCCFDSPDMDVPRAEWYTTHGMGAVYLEVEYADEAGHMLATGVEVNRAYNLWIGALREDGVGCDVELDDVVLSWEPNPIVGGTVSGRAWDLCGNWWIRVSTWDAEPFGFVHPQKTALAQEIGHVIIAKCTGDWSHANMERLLEGVE